MSSDYAASSLTIPKPVHVARYRAALERVRLRAIVAIEKGLSAPRKDRLADVESQMLVVERTLRDTNEDGRDTTIAVRLGLKPDEVDLLWTAVAISADPRVVPHLQVLTGTQAARGASVVLHAMLAQLDGERSLELGIGLNAAHPLLRYRLLIPVDNLLSVERAFVVAPRFAAYLSGRDLVDPELDTAGGVVLVPDDLCMDDGMAAAIDRLTQVLDVKEPVFAVVDGPIGVGRRTAVAIAAGRLGRQAIAADVARLPPGVDALERVLAALVREQVLTGAIPVLAGVEELVDAEANAPRMRVVARAIEAARGPFIITATQHGLDIGAARPQVRLSIPVPETRTRRMLWDRALGGSSTVEPADRDFLAMRYRLGPGGVGDAVRAARLPVPKSAALGLSELMMGVRNNIADRMGGLAARVQVKQHWDELVLGKDTISQIQALIARVRHGHLVLEEWGLGAKLARGTGVAALFSGPPGTGKTMVAGLIARELDLELYQVDLSKVVSKWVGETERQLSKIFDAAEAGHALLLFDEADALFAKRTEVKAAVDRYANLEVNYLLQRVESFGGITILTTNLDQSIDPALMRRLAGHIKFWPPEQDERVALWQGMLPATVPLADGVNFAELASRFPDMTGANIRNAAIAGAFLAASEGTKVTMKHLERAARGEYASMGRALSGQNR